MSVEETVKSEIEIRSMDMGDIDSILVIDRKIRGTQRAVTYKELATYAIFRINRKAGKDRRPISYADLITGDITGLLEFGFVATAGNHVHGFILGQTIPIGEPAVEAGLIVIIGVDPDYCRQGIATRLVNALLEKFRSKGIKTVRTDIYGHDSQLRDFFEHTGFYPRQIVKYSRTL
ncbi:GNAT family N-acetyltransferase [Chloroflexota bacterium]